MAVEKYLKLGTTGTEEVAGLQSSAGVADAGKFPALDSTGRIHTSMMPIGVGTDTKVVPASENLSAGDLVNLWSDSGTLKARKADASGGVAKQCDGFVTDAVSLGQNATVYFDGTITGLTSLTLGAKYYLSGSVAGGVTATIPTTATHIAQSVGKASSATELVFEIGEPIIRA